MQLIVLTEHELERLYGEPAEVMKLYVCLRRRMDFATGLVGAATAVSWWALREDMHVAAGQGRGESGTPTERMVEKKIERLIALGLVERKTMYRRLMFLLPIAHRAPVRQKEVGPTWGRQAGPEVGPYETQEAQGFQEEAGPEVGPTWGREVGPTSGIRVNNHSVVNAAAALPTVVDAREMLLLPAQIAEFLREAEKRRGKILRVAETDPLLKTWSAEKVGIDDLRAAHAAAVADRDARNAPEPITPGFLRIFLDRHRKSAQQGADGSPWFVTASGIEAKGKALGLTQSRDESFPYFKRRVFAAAGLDEEEARRWQA